MPITDQTFLGPRVRVPPSAFDTDARSCLFPLGSVVGPLHALPTSAAAAIQDSRENANSPIIAMPERVFTPVSLNVSVVDLDTSSASRCGRLRDESPNDLDARLDSYRTVQNAGEHNCSVLDKGVGW